MPRPDAVSNSLAARDRGSGRDLRGDSIPICTARVALKQIQHAQAHQSSEPRSGSSPRPRSRATWNTRASFRFTVWEPTPKAGRTTRCGSCRARLCRGPSTAFMPGSTRDFTGREFRWLLRRFMDVCNPVAYAHSRGILHRDLKPGNIMLGPFGETLVMDWGVAKVICAARIGRVDR